MESGPEDIEDAKADGGDACASSLHTHHVFRLDLVTRIVRGAGQFIGFADSPVPRITVDSRAAREHESLDSSSTGSLDEVGEIHEGVAVGGAMVTHGIDQIHRRARGMFAEEVPDGAVVARVESAGSSTARADDLLARFAQAARDGSTEGASRADENHVGPVVLHCSASKPNRRSSPRSSWSPMV